MERKEAIEIFLAQLDKVPNRDECEVATKEEIEEIAARIDFEGILNSLKENEEDVLDLTQKDIPKDQHFEAVFLASALLNEYSEDEIYTWEIWDESDKETNEMLDKARELLICEWLSELTIDDFLEYAVSDKPDF